MMHKILLNYTVFYLVYVHVLTPFVLSLFISLNEYSEQPSDKSYKYISVHAIISAIKDFLANNTYFVP